MLSSPECQLGIYYVPTVIREVFVISHIIHQYTHSSHISPYNELAAGHVRNITLSGIKNLAKLTGSLIVSSSFQLKDLRDDNACTCRAE